MVSISLSHDGSNYTSTFSNGQNLTSIVEKGSFTITQGFTFGSVRTQNCKCTISENPSFVDEFCSYEWIKVYKDNVLKYTGKLQSVKVNIETKDFRSVSLVYDDLSCDWQDKVFMKVIAEDDPHRVVTYNGGDIEQDILYTQAQITYLEEAIPIVTALPQSRFMRQTLTKQLAELRKTLADLQDQKDGAVIWVLEYIETDGIKICDPSDTSHSLLHIIYGYLTTMTLDCTYSDTTIVSYFKATGDDKVLEVFSNFLKQNGLYAYVTNSTVHIGNLLVDSGTATSVTNIESGGSISERPYIDMKIPDVRYLNLVEEYEDVELYKLSENDSKVKVKAFQTYPENSPILKTVINGQTITVTKDNYNHVRLDYPHSSTQEIVRITDTRFKLVGANNTTYRIGLDWYSGTLVPIKATQNGLYFDWKLLNPTHKKLHFENFIVYGNVLMTNYNSIQKHPDLSNGEEERCPYIYTEVGAGRYLETMAYAKTIDAKNYDFYSTQDIAIGSFVAINNVNKTGEVLMVTQKTDALDGEGGYTYKAVDAYKTSGIAYDSDFQASDIVAPSENDDFNLTATRTVIECYSNKTPKDTTSVTVTIKPFATLKTPTASISVNGTTTAITLIQDTVTVIEEDAEKTEHLQQWHADIDPNLNGYDTAQISVTVGDITRTITLQKNVPASGMNPDIIVPEDYVLVKQYCYGTQDGPDPRFVADASYSLEDANDLVSDIFWVSENLDGTCPLRPRGGYYIWLRQGYYDPDTETEPSTWTISLYDSPYLRFDCSVSSSTYIRNLRNPQGTPTSIAIIPNIVGYDTSLLAPYTSYGTLGSSDWDDEIGGWILDIPQTIIDDSITVGIILGNMSKYFVLAVDDITERNQYFGVYPKTVGLNTYNEPSDDTSNICIVGDRYLKTDGTPMMLSDIDGNTYTWATTNSKEAWAVMLDDALSNPNVTLDNNSSYVIWIANLAVKDAFIRNLLAQKLQIQEGGYIFGGDVVLDNDGNPASIGSRGGFIIGADGIINAKKGVFEQVTIEKSSVFKGDLQITDTNGKTVISTNKIVQNPVRIKASKIDGTDTPSAYNQAEWYQHIKNWINTNFSTDTSYACTNSTYGGQTIYAIRKSSGTGEVLKTDQYTANAHTAGNWTVFTNNTLCPVTISLYIYACHTEGMFGIDRYYSAFSAKAYYSSDNSLAKTFVDRSSSSSDNRLEKTEYTVPVGCYVKVTINGGGGQTWKEESGHVQCWYDESANFNSGINMIHKMGSGSLAIYMRIPLESLGISGIKDDTTRIQCSVGTKELVYSANASWPITKYYTFAYASGYAPQNTEPITTSLLSNVTYESPDGTSKTVAYITYNSSEIEVHCTNGDVDTYTVGSYYYSHDIDISVLTAVIGMKVRNLDPIIEDPTEDGHIGTAQEPWENIWSHYINGVAQSISKRSSKTNIVPYEGDALAIIKRTGIVSFNYKFEVGTDKCWPHYGFIADDTDEELATPNHDVMDTGSCIGMMMKAIQQLSEEINRLKETINGR